MDIFSTVKLKMPKVSVIIPSYNIAQYIGEAIDTVLRQTFKDYEIIIIDSSTDNTREIIQGYLEKYPSKIKYFYQLRAGIAAARNKGIAESSGDYIAILEDDIWILPEKLELQVKILEENPDAAMVYTDSAKFERGRVIRASWCRSNYEQPPGSFRWKILQKDFNDGSILKGYLFQDLLYENLIPISTTLIRKSCFNNIGYFDVNVFSEDYDMCIRISEKFPIIYLNKVTLSYRCRDDSTSGPINIRPFLYNCANSEIYKKLIKTHPGLKNFLQARIFQLYKEATWGYLHNLSFKEARESAFKSLHYRKIQLRLYLYILLSFLPITWFKCVRRIKYNLQLF